MCVRISPGCCGVQPRLPWVPWYLSPACSCCVCMESRSCGLHGTECVSAESCPLSRGLLPGNPDGERIDNVLVARIPVEVPTICGKSTKQWVYFTPGRVSHRIVPLEWIDPLCTILGPGLLINSHLVPFLWCTLLQD